MLGTLSDGLRREGLLFVNENKQRKFIHCCRWLGLWEGTRFDAAYFG
jgi:hypothetical protein